MPTVDIPDKICPHCGGTKWYKRKHKKSKNGIRYTCSIKVNEQSKKYNKKITKDPEKLKKIKARQKTWEQNNKEKRKLYVDKYLQTEKGKLVKAKKEKLNDARKRERLNDVYLRKQLKHHFKLPSEFITEDSMNKYKTYLLAFRQLKQLENEKINN